MKINENLLPIIFYLLSFVVAIVGSIFGIMLIDQKEIGIFIIIFMVISGVILFGISKALQFLIEIKGLCISVTPEQKVEKEELALVNENKKEDKNEEKVTPSDRPYNEPVEWTLTEKQKANIFEYYRKDNQRVIEKDIFVSPFKGYCVVKTTRFVDVIEIVNDQPITLNREQVESFSGLREWIQTAVFGKKN